MIDHLYVSQDLSSFKVEVHIHKKSLDKFIFHARSYVWSWTANVKQIKRRLWVISAAYVTKHVKNKNKVSN